jgi:feruloyl-CoA synthase
VRVKGPNITPGYYKDTERTRAAFDDEGFFISGDAMTLTDPDDMTRGLRFDGRISEDFKLQSGTWVRAAALRLQLLPALAPLAQDVILTGEGRTEVGLLIVPTPASLTATDLRDVSGAAVSATLMAAITERLRPFAEAARGSASRIARTLILTEPPSMAEGEITAKGNLNFSRLLNRRAGLLSRLHDDSDPAVIRFDG